MKLFRFIALSLFVISSAFATVWHVPDSLSTIQAAIDTAQSGDTVLVFRAYQNFGPVEIVGKQIALLSKNYIANPATYNLATGTALYDTLSSSPLLKINHADSSIIKGFLFDQTGEKNGGGVVIENSEGVLIDGVFFNSNNLSINNASVTLDHSRFYGFDSLSVPLLQVFGSQLQIENTLIRETKARSLMVSGSGSELIINNFATMHNTCSEALYNIGSSSAYFNFMTSYGNSHTGSAWSFASTWINIENSVLEFSPPVDISQCEINYTAVPGNYPGNGNISLDPQVDITGTFPVLLDISPCISAANADTSGIPRTDILGNSRPNPEWAPPDMGAAESERHMLLNDDHVFWVTQRGDDIWGNGSPDYPFASLQAAIDYAQTADTIILKPGTYYGTSNIVEKSLVLSSEFLLNGDSTYVDSVILFPDTAASSTIFLLRDVDTTSISGMTLTGGTGRFFYNNYSLGGAIYCENSTCNLALMKILNNHVLFSGGGLYASGSKLTIDHVDFSNNSAYFGGAVSIANTTAKWAHMNFDNNVASSGGAISIEDNSKFILFYSRISQNTANNDTLALRIAKAASISQYGGGLYAVNSDLRIHNTLFDHNLAANKGGAIAIQNSDLMLVQSTVADNYSQRDSSGVLYSRQAYDPIIIVNSILWNPLSYEIETAGSDLDIASSLIQDGMAGIINPENSDIESSNLIQQNPLFITNYMLDASSPAQGQGQISYVFDSQYLIHYGSSDYNGPSPSLGYTGAYPAIYYVLESVESSIVAIPVDHVLISSYPNPFNPNTTLHFVLPETGSVQLSIFNLSGRLIQTLLNHDLDAGEYSINFNAPDLPSGVYICRLVQNGNLKAAHKILLVK